MHSKRGNAYKGTIASSALALALTAGGAPLPRDAASANDEGRAERRLSEADLALSDPRLDPPEISSVNIYAQFLGTDGSRRANSADLQVFDPSPGSTEAMLRGFVTVRRASAQPSAAQPPRANNHRPSEDSLGVDLGLSSNEWIRESVQGVIASVLSLAVDERGNASFSVLGLGDFSIVISADRSELAFASGDDVLATARRGGGNLGRDAGYPGYDDAQRSHRSTPPPVPGESPFRLALELALEVASHPLSFIVYALIGGYALVWGLLSARARRHSSGGGSRRSSRHHSVPSVLSAAAVIPAPAVKKAHKRTRVRVRARKYR